MKRYGGPAVFPNWTQIAERAMADCLDSFGRFANIKRLEVRSSMGLFLHSVNSGKSNHHAENRWTIQAGTMQGTFQGLQFQNFLGKNVPGPNLPPPPQLPMFVLSLLL